MVDGPTSENPPATSGPSSSCQDPYSGNITVTTVSTGSPTPGEAEDGAANLMTLHVPAEDTYISLGAASAGAANSCDADGDGAKMGIRMNTEHHIHATAGEPLSTISLGAAGGRVGSFEKVQSAGISLYTAEDLSFEVGGEWKGHIQGNQDIHITGMKEEKVDSKRLLEIEGATWERKVGYFT